MSQFVADYNYYMQQLQNFTNADFLFDSMVKLGDPDQQSRTIASSIADSYHEYEKWEKVRRLARSALQLFVLRQRGIERLPRVVGLNNTKMEAQLEQYGLRYSDVKFGRMDNGGVTPEEIYDLTLCRVISVDDTLASARTKVDKRARQVLLAINAFLIRVYTHVQNIGLYFPDYIVTTASPRHLNGVMIDVEMTNMLLHTCIAHSDRDRVLQDLKITFDMVNARSARKVEQAKERDDEAKAKAAREAREARDRLMAEVDARKAREAAHVASLPAPFVPAVGRSVPSIAKHYINGYTPTTAYPTDGLSGIRRDVSLVSDMMCYQLTSDIVVIMDLQLGEGTLGTVVHACVFRGAGLFAIKAVGCTTDAGAHIAKNEWRRMMDPGRDQRHRDGPLLGAPQRVLPGPGQGRQQRGTVAVFGREITRQLVKGLVAIHAAGVIHNDITPDNLFLTLAPRDARAAIGDLGIAKGAEHTQVTPAVTRMANEWILPGPGSAADDVFSLVVCLYYMFTSRHPLAHRPDRDRGIAELSTVARFTPGDAADKWAAVKTHPTLTPALADLMRRVLVGTVQTAVNMAHHPVFWTDYERGARLVEVGNTIYSARDGGSRHGPPVTSSIPKDTQEALISSLGGFFPSGRVATAVRGTYSDLLVLISHAHRHFTEWRRKRQVKGTLDQMMTIAGGQLEEVVLAVWVG